MTPRKTLVFLLILCFCAYSLCSGRNEIENLTDIELYNGDEWKGYRLGDCIKLTRKIGGPEGSLCERFRASKNYKPGDYDSFSKLIPKRKPKADVTVHLRVGDVVEKDSRSVSELMKGDKELKARGGALPGSVSYVKPTLYFENAIKNIPKGAKTVEFVVGSHKSMDGKLPKSKEYIEKVGQIFKNAGYKVSISAGGNPDEDMINLINSKNFIGTGGSFSKVPSILVPKRGGRVLTEFREKGGRIENGPPKINADVLGPDGKKVNSNGK